MTRPDVNAHAPGGEAASRSHRPPGWINFTARRKELLVRFVGRKRELAQLDEWLLGPGEAMWVVVTGSPGMGKSTILSAWLAQRETADTVPPHHFIVRSHAKTDQPEVIAASLAAHVEAAYPHLRDPEAAPEARLTELLDRVSERLGASGRLVIVVDGLDETHAEAGDNPLPRFLPLVVPTGIRFLCATRPTYPHLSWLVARRAVRRIDLDDPQWAESNREAVRGFWERAAAEYQPLLAAPTIETAIERAEGNILHAAMLHDAWQAVPASERRADRIPQGLRELLDEVWDRATEHDESVRVGLGLLCAAQEALSLDVLAGLAGWDHDERVRVLRKARQLLLEEPASWVGVEAYRPRHDWVRELMAERLGASTMRAHHRALSATLARWPAPGDAIARRYALRHALTHRAEAGDRADAWRLAADMSFLEAMCRELGVHATETDVTRLAERCRASGDVVLGQCAEGLARALARESHWLRAAPEATSALVWNRLRRSGWSAEEIDGQLRVPEGAGFLRVRQVHTRESPALVRNLPGHTYGVTACAVTPDGRYVISASDDQTLKVWELASGRALATLVGHTDRVTACAVTPDGRRLVSASEDQTLKVWELASGRALATLEGHTDEVSACAVTPDGRYVISASDDQTLRVWELASGRALATLAGHTDRVTACAVTPDGRHVVSASWDQTLKVWELASGRALATLEGHTGGVTACAVTPDGHVVSASEDQTLKVWELPSGRARVTLEDHTGGVTACAVTPDGYVVSASHDQTLKVWELASGCPRVTLEGHTDSVIACAVTPNGRHVVSASSDQTLKVWELASERALATPEGHTDWVRACAVTPDGRYAISASHDWTLKVWELASGRAWATFQCHANRVRACAVTPDGQQVISASQDQTLKVWELTSGCVLATLQGHTDVVTACAVTPDGRHVVSASGDQTLKVWELASGRELTTLQGHTDVVRACAVTPDGRRVVSASDDETLKVWELASGRVLATLQGHTHWVSACAVTPDGRHVVSASWDQTLKVWELASGRVLATLQGHTDRVSACAVTPDGRHVVSASDDQTVKVWGLETYLCCLTHRGDAAYRAVAATATVIVSGDHGGGVWFLDMPAPYRSARPTSIREGVHRESTPRALQAPTSSRRTMNNPEDMEPPVMKNPDVREGTEFPATVVFILIKGIKDCSDGPKVPNALRALNEALGGVDPGAFVLSTLAGVIVVVPDTVSWSADDVFHALDQAKVGFALRVGVTHGTVEVVRDIDDEPNLIGPPINIAARLATSNDNPGVLIHESYAELVDGILSAAHWLHRSVRKAISIRGKPQDPEFTCFPGPHRFDAKPLEREEPYASRPTVLVAYDLPKFSAGDRAQLRKRFTRLAHVFQKLWQSAPMQTATALLSPGGDGGVLVLQGVNLPDAAAITSRLQALTEIESLDHEEVIAVEIRIGAHYGPVAHYVNARGIERPTGLAVFVADEIAGDEHARSRKSIILTRLLADSLAGGSSQRLASEFEQLPKLTSGPASGVERFVKAGPTQARSDTRASSLHPSGHQPGHQAARTLMTRDDLLTRLSRLLPSQFEEVLFRAKVPMAHLPGAGASQAERAMAAIRHLEQHNQLDQLAPILEAVATGPS